MIIVHCCYCIIAYTAGTSYYNIYVWELGVFFQNILLTVKQYTYYRSMVDLR